MPTRSFECNARTEQAMAYTSGGSTGSRGGSRGVALGPRPLEGQAEDFVTPHRRRASGAGYTLVTSSEATPRVWMTTPLSWEHSHASQTSSRRGDGPIESDAFGELGGRLHPQTMALPPSTPERATRRRRRAALSPRAAEAYDQPFLVSDHRRRGRRPPGVPR